MKSAVRVSTAPEGGGAEARHRLTLRWDTPGVNVAVIALPEDAFWDGQAAVEFGYLPADSPGDPRREPVGREAPAQIPAVTGGAIAGSTRPADTPSVEAQQHNGRPAVLPAGAASAPALGIRCRYTGAGLAATVAASVVGVYWANSPPTLAVASMLRGSRVLNQAVLTQTVHADALPGGDRALRYPAEAAARYSNIMSFRIGGKLLERRVRLGDAVTHGQVLARLDQADSKKQLQAARAALGAAEQRLVFARTQLARDRAQAAQNLIAASQLEQTEEAFSSARAAREQAEAQQVVASHTLEYNTLVAEHDGVITSENADTGQVLASGQAVYGLAWSGDNDAVLDVSSADIGQIALDQAATVSFPALPGKKLAARVREIAPAADPATRTFRVKLSLLGEGAQGVRLGMSGEAELTAVAAGDAPQASPTFTIPSTALFHQGEYPAVWVLDARSRLMLKPVRVLRHGAEVCVVSGITDGEVIVVAGVHAVYAGEAVSAVKPLNEEEGKASAALPSLGQLRQGAGR